MRSFSVANCGGLGQGLPANRSPAEARITGVRSSELDRRLCVRLRCTLGPQRRTERLISASGQKRTFSVKPKFERAASMLPSDA